jgi:hypothetical protein
MGRDLAAALATGLWITRRHADDEGGRGRSYEVRDAAGALLLRARSTVWGREIPLRWPDDVEALMLRRRRAFPLTGRVDMLEPGGRLVGAVYRNGRFADAAGRTLGRFRDARTMRERTGEAVLQGVFEAVIGGDGAQPANARAFVCMSGDGVVGTLASMALPFAQTEPAEPSLVARISRRVLPKRAMDTLRAVAAPRGWRLDVAAEMRVHDPLLVTGAALFTVELSYW